jgi:hypothetical protein
MPQTLFALLALIIAILFAATQQQSMVIEYEDVIRDEMEIIASGVALQVMEHVASYPFDELVTEEDYSISSFSVNDLADFPFNGQSGGTCEDAANGNGNAGGNSGGNGNSENSNAGGNGNATVTTFDEADLLEEFHCTETQVTFQTADMPQAFTFDVDVYVHYIDDDKEHTNSRTDTKEVIVTVGHERFTNHLAQLRRSFAP